MFRKKKGHGFRLLAAFLSLSLMILGMNLSASATQSGVKMEITASVTGEGASMINSLLNDCGISISGSHSEDGALLNFSLRLLGQEAVKLLLEANQETLAFSLPEIEEGRFEIKMSRILEALRAQSYGSLKLPGSEEEYHFSPFPFAGPEITPEEYEAALLPYFEYFSAVVSEGVESETSVPIELSRIGSTVEGDLYTYSPDAQDLAKIFTELADRIEADTALRGIVEKWADYIGEMDGIFITAPLSVTPDELASSETDSQEADEKTPAQEAAEEIMEEFGDLPEELREAAASLLEEGMNGVKLTFRAGTADGQCCLLAVRMEDGEGGYYEAGLENMGSKSTREAALFFGDATDSYAAVLRAMTDDVSDSGTVTFHADDTEAAELTYAWNKTQRSLLGIPFGSISFSLRGSDLLLALTVSSSAQGGEDHTLYLTGLEDLLGDDTITGGVLTLHSEQTDEILAPEGEVTDITDYDNAQFQQLAENLMEKVSARIGSIFGTEE